MPSAPDQHIGRYARTILEPGFNMVTAVREARQPVPEMQPLDRYAGRDHIQQIAAMERHMRCAMQLFAQRVQRRLSQGPPIVPAALMSTQRAYAHPIERGTEAQTKQDATGIGTHVDATADLGQLRGLFVNIHAESGLV